MGEHLVMSSIGGGDVTCAERSNVRRFEHFLQLLDVVNDAFNVHSVSISDISTATVKRVPGTAPANGKRAVPSFPTAARFHRTTTPLPA